MSADNGIYVLATHRTKYEYRSGYWRRGELHNVWRVAHAQAIENLSWYKENELYMLGWYLAQIWGESEVFDSLEAALVHAHKIAEEQLILEYGVSVINLAEYRFPGDY